ncbi:MAG: ABC transporter ATP-binding protein [Pyrinomonadaceae bacterium]
MSENRNNILSVTDLKVHFRTDGGAVKAVDGVSFQLEKGKTLGIVGESGSGKSVTSLSLMRLLSGSESIDTSGHIMFSGVDVLGISPADMRKLRGRRMAMIFQDPMTSLNPYLKISKQLTEVTRLHLGHNRSEARTHAINMLNLVGISDAESRIDNYPHEFSGGMRQRVMIAMALSCEPELLIADEPTTALDVTIQAQILELVKDLRSRMKTSVILITHDLGVVAGMTDDVIVMYAGKVFESAPTAELFASPANPYTKGLLKSLPRLADNGKELYQIPGMPPDLSQLPTGCPFAERCYRAEDICHNTFPPFVRINEHHRSLCHFADEVFADSLREKTKTADASYC